MRKRFAALSTGAKAVVVAVAVLLIVAGGAFVSKAFHVVAGVAAVVAGGHVARRRVAPDADDLRADADSAIDAGDVRDVQREDVQRDASSAESARIAGENAATGAAGDWTRNAHRKPPGLREIVAFLALSAAAPKALAQYQTDNAAGDNCIRISEWKGETPPDGFGFWHESGGEYFCPCFGRVDQFYDATRLPGGCLVPPMLPLVAYTVGDNARMWADMEAAAVRLKSLNADVATAREQRDALAEQLRTCGGRLNRAADVVATAPVYPPNRLTWYAIGAASGLAASLLAVLLIN
jgi:hypothetical protein